MNINMKGKKLAVVLGLLSSALALPSYAAVITAAGEDVANTAKITSYKVNGNEQITAPADEISSNTVTFKVDRLVDLVVTQVGSPVSVTVGSTAQMATFTVTNNSNATLNFNLTAAEVANSTTVPGGSDSDDSASGFTIYVDTNDNGVYDAGVDQQVTTISGLSAETATSGENVKTVFVFADIKATSANAAVIGVSLKAQATELDGSALVQTVGADNPNAVDTVFGDAAGVVSGDVARDAAHSDYGSFKVTSATLTVLKSSAVVWDPLNLASSPKAIPGAVVKYCLVVTNSGTEDATSVVLADEIPDYTAYYSAVAGTGAPAPGVTTGTGATCGTSVDGTSLGSYNADTVTVNYSTIAKPVAPATGVSVWAQFYVTIQ